MFNLTPKEKKIFEKLNTPQKIQDFLDQVPSNFEPEEETLFSPRELLRENRAHCMEAALFASAVLWYHGHKPLLLDLRVTRPDFDHVVALFQANGYWGAVSKSNHAVLRYRDPIYKTIRELVLSYFHEYYLDNGKKTLRNYSQPFDLRKLGTSWVTDDDNLWYIDKALNKSPHINLLTPKMIKQLRLADKIQIQAGKIIQFKQRGK